MSSGLPAAIANPPDILRVENLEVDYRVKRRGDDGVRAIHAVKGVDLVVKRGQTHGLVGESGCGKTTLVRAILCLTKAKGGKVLFNGDDLLSMGVTELKSRRPQFQVVFQDPYSSLNGRMSVHDIVAEPLRLHHKYSARRVDELLNLVGVSPASADRLPAEFSGGQRQRVGIARALALSPSLLILDEPVSALDKSIQAQVLNLLLRLQVEQGLSYLFISHDLSVVRFMSDSVSVMFQGRIVEGGDREEVFTSPAHPYTSELIRVVPSVRFDRRQDKGTKTPFAPVESHDKGATAGCEFCGRCERKQPICREIVPQAREWSKGTHQAACLFGGAQSPPPL
jgi:peptide/nickel transport system ATP-binding protein